MLQTDLKEYIKAHFAYINGQITRNDRKNSNGSIDKDGYLIIKVKTKQFKAHRIAWLLNYGEFPDGELDHINHNRLDNRIENLRIADRTLQNRNKTFKPNPRTGVVGISVDNSTVGLKAKYTFRFHNKTYRFRSLEEAIKAKERLRNERFN